MTTNQELLQKDKDAQRNIGIRAKSVRERLKMTLDVMSKVSAEPDTFWFELTRFEEGVWVATSVALTHKPFRVFNAFFPCLPCSSFIGHPVGLIPGDVAGTGFFR